MSASYGTRSRGGTKSILAKQKRTASGDKSGAPKARKRLSMVSSDALVGLMENGRPRDRNKIANELSKRGVAITA